MSSASLALMTTKSAKKGSPDPSAPPTHAQIPPEATCPNRSSHITPTMVFLTQLFHDIPYNSCMVLERHARHNNLDSLRKDIQEYRDLPGVHTLSLMDNVRAAFPLVCCGDTPGRYVGNLIDALYHWPVWYLDLLFPTIPPTIQIQNPTKVTLFTV